MGTTGSGVRASDGHEIAFLRAEPGGRGPQPALIVFPSIFGISDELAEHAREIAASGALVVVFNPFSRTADAGGCGEGERDRAFARVSGLDFKQVTRDFRELLARVKSDPACNGRVVGLGICLGGPFVFNAAADGELDGVATWHGSRMSGVVGRASEVRCPVVMDYGDADPIAPKEEIDKVEAACGVIGDFTLRVHAGAGHGFSHTGWDGHRADVMAQARGSLEQMLAALRG